MANILDFTDNGGTIIEIPNFLKPTEKTIIVEIPKFQYSALIFFKEPFTQLLEIEKDIPLADTDERREFLLNYKSILEKYADNNADFGKDYWNNYKRKNPVYAYFKQLGIRLSISNYQLRHSLAWYIQTFLDEEIGILNNQIELLEGIIKVGNENLAEKMINCFRSSNSPQDAINNLIKEYNFTEKQASFFCKMILRRLMSLDLSGTKEKEQIKIHKEFISFLQELKNVNTIHQSVSISYQTPTC